MNKLTHKRVVDKLIDAYVSWRETCVGVSDAYASWASETGLGATSAFGRYMAALDQEERAAEVYAERFFMLSYFVDVEATLKRVAELDVADPAPAPAAAGRPGHSAAPANGRVVEGVPVSDRIDV